jgi:hypothetical protein
MDKTEYTARERWLTEPKPGTAAARARDFGVNLSETVANLRLTPDERVRKLDRLCEEHRRNNLIDVIDYDRDLASLLELEAILEYQNMIESGEI